MLRSAQSPLPARIELESPALRALRRLFQRKGAVVGLVVIATFIVLAVFAPFIVPHDPIGDELDAGAQTALGAALVRHR